MATDPTKLIMLVDDDEEDRMLALDALREAGIQNPVLELSDGQQALDCLLALGPWAPPHEAPPRPDLILLDLNMPRLDGRGFMAELRRVAPSIRTPVVVLTTSHTERDVGDSYDLGVAGFITKPVTYEALVEIMRVLGLYWLETVKLPAQREV